MRSASEPKTTRLAAKKAQFSTAISSAVFLPKGASAFGNGNGCELPAARIIGVIFSGLRIQGLRQNKRRRRQTPAASVAFCAGFRISATFVSPCHHAASAIKCALRPTPSLHRGPAILRGEPTNCVRTSLLVPSREIACGGLQTLAAIGRGVSRAGRRAKPHPLDEDASGAAHCARRHQFRSGVKRYSEPQWRAALRGLGSPYRYRNVRG